MKNILTLLISLFISSLLLNINAQTVYNSVTSGNWNTVSTWQITTYVFVAVPFPHYVTSTTPATTPPTATDYVSVNDGHTVTINNSANSASVTISSSSSATPAKLIVNSSFTLATDSLYIYPSGDGSSSIDNSGTINLAKLAFNTSNSVASATFTNNGVLNTSTTSITEATGTISLILNGGSTFTTTDVSTTNTSPANTSIDLSSGNGVFKLINGGFTGNLITFNGGNAGSIIEYKGNTAQTITASNPNFIFDEIRVLNTTGATLDGALTLANINGDLRTAGTGIINQGGFDITLPARIFISTNGTFNGNANITTTTNIVNHGTFNQTVGIATVGNDLDNSGTYNAQGAIDITRHFNNQAAGSFVSTGCNINVERNWTNNGTYTYQTGDVVSLDGTGGNSNFTGTTEFYELNITKSGLRANVENGDIINIRSILNIDAGDMRVTGTGAVTLLSDASGTAQFDVLESGATYTGDLIVQRYLAMANDGWRELTSPVSGTTLADWQDDGIILTGFPGADYDASNWYGWINSWTYNQPNASGVKDNGWVAATSNTNATTFTNGHRIYIGTGNNTLSVKGNPVMGLQSAAISNAGGAADDQNGWNLIGNPYPCTIDWNTLAKSNTEEAIWIWNATAGNYGIYQTGAGSGTNGVDNHIAHSQAFWVHGTGGAGSVIFQEVNKVRNDKAFVKSSNTDEFVRIKLSGTVNSYSDEAILTFNQNATDVYDAGIDQNKLYTELEHEAPSLAITTTDNYDLSIAGVNEFKSSTIPLKAFAGDSAYGTYTLDFTFPDNALNTSCITLEDLETGAITDLKTTPSYSFTTTASSPQDRFLIHITTPFESTVFEPSCASLVDGGIQIEGSNVLGNTFTLANTSGVISSVTASTNQVSFENLPSGEYTVTSSQNSACGYNTLNITITEPQEVIANFSLNNSTIYLDDNASITPNNSSTGDNYTWDFGDGNISFDENPSHTYTTSGIYTITLTVDANGCESTYTQTIDVRTTTGIEEAENTLFKVISFNNYLQLSITEDLHNAKLNVTDISGRVVFSNTINNNVFTISTEEFAKGAYLVNITYNNKTQTKKVIIR